MYNYVEEKAAYVNENCLGQEFVDDQSQCREAHKKDEANDEGQLNYTKNKNKKRWPTRTMIQMMRRRLKIMMGAVLRSIATTLMIAMDMKWTNNMKQKGNAGNERRKC